MDERNLALVIPCYVRCPRALRQLLEHCCSYLDIRIVFVKATTRLLDIDPRLWQVLFVASFSIQWMDQLDHDY